MPASTRQVVRQVLHNPPLPDLRVLAGIAEEMGVPLGFRTPEHVWDEMDPGGPVGR